MIEVHPHDEGCVNDEASFLEKIFTGLANFIAWSHIFNHPRQHPVRFTVSWATVAGLTVCFILFALSPIIDEVVIPVINSCERHLSPVEIGVVVLAWLSIAPVFLIPSGPPIWLAANTLPVHVTFCLLLLGGLPLAVTSVYLVGRFLFRIHLVKVANKGRPRFKALLLTIREVGPIKGIITVRLALAGAWASYICAVSEEVDNYFLYAVLSVLVEAPFWTISILLARELDNISALLKGQDVPLLKIITITVSATAGLILTTGGFFYARKIYRQRLNRSNPNV